MRRRATIACRSNEGVVLIAAWLLVIALASFPSRVASQSTDGDATTYRGGTSLQLTCLPENCRDDDRFDTFQLEPGHPLHAELGFIQWYSEAKQFRLFCLLNYGQANFAVQQNLSRSGGELAPLAPPLAIPGSGRMHPVLEFTVPPEQELYFDLWTEPLAAGFYDLALVVVPDPDRNQRELPYFTVAQATTRASIYVGADAKPPTVDFPLIDPTPAPDSGFGELLWFGQEPHKAGLKSGQVVEAGAEVALTVNYQPYAGNLADDLPPGTPIPAAFVAFLDDHVAPLNGQPVLYGSGLPGRLSYISVTIGVPADPGLHQVFIVQFPNPYVDVQEAEESGRELVGLSSQRFILEVT